MATNRITLDAHPRTSMTKGEKNQIRKRGDLPGILYGKNREPQPIYVTGESFKQLKGHGSVLVDVNISGDGIVSAMVNEVERDIMKHMPLHIDLHVVDLRQPINVEVQVILDGLEEAEKGGGIIQQQQREVTVRCLPTEVPEYILHNIATLQIGDNVRAGQLTLPQEVELASDPDEMICAVIEAKNAPADTEGTTKEPELVHDQEGKGESQITSSDDERYSASKS